MIDRRLPYLKRLETFLTAKHPDWSSTLVFEWPPAFAKDVDISLPCFSLAKLRRQPPPVCAEAIAADIKTSLGELEIARVEVLKGYVNLSFQSQVLAAELTKRWDRPLGDAATSRADEKVILEFSSPNIAKPFGIGHLRSTNIGASLARIYSALGAQVTRINHLGDWGTQFGKMITAYKKFGNADFVKGDPVNNLYKLYVEFNQREQEDPALMDEAREWFVRLENADPEALELWHWFKDVSYHEFKRIYDRLGVDFDYVTGESFYNLLMIKTIERLEGAGLLRESEKALIVDLEPFNMPPCLVKKSDGATLYATRDLAAAEYREKTFQPTKMVYVVGGEQTLHFKQVFKVLELMGYAWFKNCVHVGFGLIKFADGKMSTRKGNLILLEEVLKQSVKEALSIVKEKNAEKPADRQLTDDEQLEVARQVGTGAVIFFDLRANRMKDVLFDWKDILSFEGDTGPYLQYSVVRMGSLLERAAENQIFPDATKLTALNTEEERALGRKLLAFPAVIEAAARENEPSMISHHLLELAGDFNHFYMKVPVLKASPEEMPARLGLIQLTQKTMQCGLSLLGIECPKRM